VVGLVRDLTETTRGRRDSLRENRIRGLLTAGAPTLGTHLFLCEPRVVETIGHAGSFDYVEFLGEYSPYDLSALENFCRAAELHDLGTMIKLDWECRGFYAQRSVGAGFESVLFADIRSADDARASVRYVRPDTPEHGGLFSAGTRRHAFPAYGGPVYIRSVADTVVAIMIEKASAVDALEEILESRPDMVQWGPYDYAMSIGRAGDETGEAVRRVERRVISMAIDAGVPARAEIETIEQAKYYADLGVRHFALGYDLYTILEVLKDAGGRLRSAIEEAT
jgi:2-keto-3-deoxy-L-rhamnonate aldolase RhmA